MPEVFTMIPAPAKAAWIFWGVSALTLALTALFLWLALAMGNVRFEVSSSGLRIRGDLFGRSIPASSLLVDQARPLDLGAEREYRPRWRTMGTAVPGYRGGWFRLYNGEKALVFVTRPESVAYVPTRDGYSVMVSVEDPEEFIRALARARDR